MKRKILMITAVCICVAAAALTVFLLVRHNQDRYERVSSPMTATVQEKPARELAANADFYVAPNGSDTADGTFDAPFATIERARDAVRTLDKTGKHGVTVAVRAGEYRVNTLLFTAEDGGTADCPVTYCAYGDGEVVLNGGVTLAYSTFAPVKDETQRARLAEGARDKVLCADLGALGVTAEQYGKIYAIGSYNTAAKYDGDWVGDIYCELFVDDVRMTTARYPNGKDYLYTGEVVRTGQGKESDGATTEDKSWPTRRNPVSDVYRIDDALAERIASWAEPEKVWMFGYWKYDWADASSPLGEFSREERTLSPKFVSLYGTKTDAPYYFFNVFEELDAPGEWYLDREKGVLYLCPPENFTENSVIDLSLTTGNVLCAQDADYLTFDGFTVKGTRGDAVSLTGDHNTLKNCLIKNVAGNAVLVTGAENTVTDNEIARTGRGGVILDGGDRDTLTPGNNRAVNNLVHDWSEIYETYQPAFTLNGVGNRCDHNEMYNSTHEAITWTGNNHLIEYNLIHDVCLLTDDGGAIYAGRRWDWYGTAIRNNLIYNLGSGEHMPVGIYLDDALSGIEVSGNVLINVPGIGLQLGGGRDLDVHDNVVVNSSRSMTYDQRAIDGVFGGWFNHAAPEGDMWTHLQESPWQSEVWRSAYPAMTRFSCDFDNTDDPGFVANPACSTVTHNLFVNRSGKIGEISDAAAQYSTVENNAVMKIGKLDRLFVDPANGDYTLRDDAPLDFAVAVPALSEFGRQ